MIKRGNKSGQFYLIAAIIIATIMIGLTAVLNSSITESNVRIYDLKDEIKIESRNVFDYGLNEGLSDPQFDILLLNFTRNYMKYQGDKDIYFIFGKKENITIAGKQKENKAVSLNSVQITNTLGEFMGSQNLIAASQIILDINDLKYYFPLNQQGRNFYFVVFKQVGEGEYIISD